MPLQYVELQMSGHHRSVLSYRHAGALPLGLGCLECDEEEAVCCHPDGSCKPATHSAKQHKPRQAEQVTMTMQTSESVVKPLQIKVSKRARKTLLHAVAQYRVGAPIKNPTPFHYDAASL